MLIWLVSVLCLAAVTNCSNDLSSLSPQDQEFLNNFLDAMNMFDSSEEDAERSMTDRLSGTCDCEGNNNCGCCGKVDVIFGKKLTLCTNVSVVPAEFALRVSGRLGDLYTFFNKSISVKKLERICDRLPRPLRTVKLCLHSTLDQVGEDMNAFQSCMHLDVQVAQNVITTFNFKCMKYQNGQLTFEGREDLTGNEAISTINVPNPIKNIIDIIKKEEEDIFLSAEE